MADMANSPLTNPGATITHAVVRSALPADRWALYGRVRAGLGGLDVGYVWQGPEIGWALALRQGEQQVGLILLTGEALTGDVWIDRAEELRLLAAPELLPEAQMHILATDEDEQGRHVRWPLTDDADILGFLSVVRAKVHALTSS